MPHAQSSAPRAVPRPSNPSSRDALDYQPGQVVAGKYELTRLLGSGGMGAVWAVRHLLIDAEFALKLLRNDGGESHAAERMLREARSAARVEHPAIVRVFDFGVTERGDPFLVMDLLAGKTLRDVLLRDGPMNPLRAGRLLLPIADALSVAHSRDVIHRDVKTDNILIVPDAQGHVRPTLVDFGIAKQLHTDEQRLTMTGTVVGSPEYMSPEQVRGLSDLDQTVDIWSLSVVLFEMITGRTPFFRDGGIASILHAITDEPATSLVALGVHEPELQAILDRGLSKFRNGRFDGMRAFGVSLARWLLSRGIEEDASAQSIRAVWFGTHASTPPVAIDVRRSEPRPAAVDTGERLTPSKRGWGWPAAIAVSLLAISVAIGAGLSAKRLWRGREIAGVVQPAPDFRPENPVHVEPMPASAVGPSSPPTPSAEPVERAEPAKPAGAAVSSPPPATARVALRRPVDAVPLSHVQPAPPGVDVADLPSLFRPSAPEPSPPAGDSPAPREPASSQDRHDPPLPSGLREPYVSDNPY